MYARTCGVPAVVKKRVKKSRRPLPIELRPEPGFLVSHSARDRVACCCRDTMVHRLTRKRRRTNFRKINPTDVRQCFRYTPSTGRTRRRRSRNDNTRFFYYIYRFFFSSVQRSYVTIGLQKSSNSPNTIAAVITRTRTRVPIYLGLFFVLLTFRTLGVVQYTCLWSRIQLVPSCSTASELLQNGTFTHIFRYCRMEISSRSFQLFTRKTNSIRKRRIALHFVRLKCKSTNRYRLL